MPIIALLSSRLPWVLLAVLLAIGVPWGAYKAGHRAGWNAGVEFERAKWQAEKAALLLAAAAEADRLRGEGKALAAALEEAKAKVRTEYVDVVRVVREKASATRACFTPDITELLNRNAPIRETVERPGAPKQVIDHRTEVAPAGGTSEAAAAEWVAGAQAAHAQCRAQVGALADWIRSATKGRS
jgi:hypothetical protein